VIPSRTRAGAVVQARAAHQPVIRVGRAVLGGSRGSPSDVDGRREACAGRDRRRALPPRPGHLRRLRALRAADAGPSSGSHPYHQAVSALRTVPSRPRRIARCESIGESGERSQDYGSPLPPQQPSGLPMPRWGCHPPCQPPEDRPAPPSMGSAGGTLNRGPDDRVSCMLLEPFRIGAVRPGYPEGSSDRRRRG